MEEREAFVKDWIQVPDDKFLPVRLRRPRVTREPQRDRHRRGESLARSQVGAQREQHRRVAAAREGDQTRRSLKSRSQRCPQRGERIVTPVAGRYRVARRQGLGGGLLPEREAGAHVERVEQRETGGTDRYLGRGQG